MIILTSEENAIKKVDSILLLKEKESFIKELLTIGIENETATELYNQVTSEREKYSSILKKINNTILTDKNSVTKSDELIGEWKKTLENIQTIKSKILENVNIDNFKSVEIDDEIIREIKYGAWESSYPILPLKQYLTKNGLDNYTAITYARPIANQIRWAHRINLTRDEFIKKIATSNSENDKNTLSALLLINEYITAKKAEEVGDEIYQANGDEAEKETVFGDYEDYEDYDKINKKIGDIQEKLNIINEKQKKLQELNKEILRLKSTIKYKLDKEGKDIGAL